MPANNTEETELPPLHWGDVGEALASIRAENDWAHTILSGVVDDYLKVRQLAKAPPVREPLCDPRLTGEQIDALRLCVANVFRGDAIKDRCSTSRLTTEALNILRYKAAPEETDHER